MSDIFEKILKPSTRDFWRTARAQHPDNFWEAVHGLVYLTFPEFYIRVGLGRGRLARLINKPAYRIGKFFGVWSEYAGGRFADTYHGKAMPLADVTRLISINRPVRLEIPEKVLPYSQAREIILENPDDLALLRCPCRATVPNPCEPLDVCIIVGNPVVDFVLEHHPAKSRRISVDEAIEVVHREHMRGHVSHAFFKQAVLGRYYAICNCCPCCCGAMEAHRSGTPMLASSGYLPELDHAACIGCGKCAKACPFKAIVMTGPSRDVVTLTQTKTDTTHPKPVIGPNQCMGCGICTLACPTQAVALCLAPEKPAPLIEYLEDGDSQSA